jgi:hypothetical protein
MISIKDINAAGPVLILYSSGTGGEFITSTLSKVSKSFNNLVWFVNTEVNQTHLTCVTEYSTTWSDPLDPNTWICQRHLDKLIGPKRYLMRDHPILDHAILYNRFLPNLQVLNLTLQDNYDYYGKVTFAKLAKKVYITELTFDYVKNNITSSVDEVHMSNLYNWASKYLWVWVHELHIVNTALKSNQSIEFYEHTDSLEEHIANQSTAIEHQSTVVSVQLKKVLNNCIDIDITDIKSSKHMWEQFKIIIPDIDLKEAIKLSDIWQANNRKLIKHEF